MSQMPIPKTGRVSCPIWAMQFYLADSGLLNRRTRSMGLGSNEFDPSLWVAYPSRAGGPSKASRSERILTFKRRECRAVTP
jgi:hypothetical protein